MLLTALAALLAHWPEPAVGQDTVRDEDAKLNHVYQALEQELDDSKKPSLKAMQRAWLKWRESDLAFFSHLGNEANDPGRVSNYEDEGLAGQTLALTALRNAMPLFVANSDDRRPDKFARTAREADQFLNNIYRECLNALSPDRSRRFKEIEAAWIEYRDLYCRLDASLKKGLVDDFVLRDLSMLRVVQFRHYLTVLLERQLPVREDAKELRNTDKEDEQPSRSYPDIFRFVR